jgi:hypothetical protein
MQEKRDMQEGEGSQVKYGASRKSQQPTISTVKLLLKKLLTSVPVLICTNESPRR